MSTDKITELYTRTHETSNTLRKAADRAEMAVYAADAASIDRIGNEASYDAAIDLRVKLAKVVVEATKANDEAVAEYRKECEAYRIANEKANKQEIEDRIEGQRGITPP